jgi:hypothetical protein
MDFAKWMEEQSALPDARQFSYIACVLDKISQDHLEAAARKWLFENFGHDVPPDWTWRSHHMTVLFRQGGILTTDLEKYRNFFGEDVKLHITGIAADDNIMAARVQPSEKFEIQAAVPHITIAHSKRVGPNDSNRLLMDQGKIQAAQAVELISVFAAVKRDQVSIWPEKSFPLATPVRS